MDIFSVKTQQVQVVQPNTQAQQNPNQFVIEFIEVNRELTGVFIKHSSASGHGEHFRCDGKTELQDILTFIEKNETLKRYFSSAQIVQFSPSVLSTHGESAGASHYFPRVKLSQVDQQRSFIVTPQLSAPLQAESSQALSPYGEETFRDVDADNPWPQRCDATSSYWIGARIHWRAKLIDANQCSRFLGTPNATFTLVKNKVVMTLACKDMSTRVARESNSKVVRVSELTTALHQANVVKACFENAGYEDVNIVEQSEGVVQLTISGVNQIKSITTKIAGMSLTAFHFFIKRNGADPSMRVFTCNQQGWEYPQRVKLATILTHATLYGGDIFEAKEGNLWSELNELYKHAEVRFTYNSITYHLREKTHIQSIKYMFLNEGYDEADFTVGGSGYLEKKYPHSLTVNCKDFRGIQKLCEISCGLSKDVYQKRLNEEMSFHQKPFVIPEGIKKYQDIITRAIAFRTSTNPDAKSNSSANTSSSSSADNMAVGTTHAIVKCNWQGLQIRYEPVNNQIDPQAIALNAGLKDLNADAKKPVVNFLYDVDVQNNVTTITIKRESIKSFCEQVCGLDKKYTEEIVRRAGYVFQPIDKGALSLITGSKNKMAKAVSLGLKWQQEPVIAFTSENMTFSCATDDDAQKLCDTFLNQGFNAVVHKTLTKSVVIPNTSGMPEVVMDECFGLSHMEQADLYIQNNLTVPVKLITDALMAIGSKLTRLSPKDDFESAKKAGKELLEKVKDSLTTAVQKKEFGDIYQQQSMKSDETKPLNPLEYFKAKTAFIRSSANVVLDSNTGAHKYILDNFTTTQTVLPNSVPASDPQNAAPHPAIVPSNKGSMQIYYENL